MTDGPRWTHRAWMRHLAELEKAGPCDMPPTENDSWTDPTWLDAWLRNHPEEIRRQQTLARSLPTDGVRAVRSVRPVAPAPQRRAPEPPQPDPEAERRRLITALAHKNGWSYRQAEAALTTQRRKT